MAVFNSINTNVPALVAIRALNATNAALAITEKRVATGLRVNDATDDSSAFAIAQGIRADIKAVSGVEQALAAGKGIADVALAGATEISNLLADIKKTATSGLSPANTSAQQAAFDSDFADMISQVLGFIQNADFNGTNLLESGSSNVTVLADISGGVLTIRAQDLESTVFSALNAQNLTNASAASAALTVVNSVIQTVNVALGQLGSDSRALELQNNFITAINDALEENLGAIVDADLAKESANLAAQQAQQQLATEVLSIANATPEVLLSLFIE